MVRCGFLAWDSYATLCYPVVSSGIPGYPGPGICAPGEACKLPWTLSVFDARVDAILGRERGREA